MWHPLRPRGNDPNLDQDEAPPAPAANRPSSVNHAQVLVANRALELIGKELGLFINRKDIMHTHKEDDLDDMNERELALEHVRVAQLFLGMCEENEETENNDGE